MPGIPLITRAQELIFDLPVGRVMTSDVIALAPATPISELKEILRVRRISGTPVVDGGRLAGIISIEDLIKALECGETDAPVGQKMSRQVISIHPWESVVEAVKKFTHYKVGRLPVIDDAGRLVGILTVGDITRGLLAAIGLGAGSEAPSDYQNRPLLEEVDADEAALTLCWRVRGGDFKAGGRASSSLKAALRRLGIDPQTVRRAAIAAYEAEMNLIIHATEGGRLIAEVTPGLIRLVAQDSGPGIPDVAQALQPGYSTAPNWIRELGFGAGMGLFNISRCADAMQLTSAVGEGTRLMATFCKQAADDATPDFEKGRKAS